MTLIPTSCPATQTVKTDVLVIGGGAAGIRAALAAAENGVSVTLVSNLPPGKGGSSFQHLSGGWGIQALLREERTDAALESFYDDVLRVGLGVANPSLVRILVEESGPCLEDLLTMGIRFKTDEHGGFIRVNGCFSNHRRAFLTESMENVKQAFVSAIRRSSVNTFTGEALQLLHTQGRCWGAWGLHESGTLFRIIAPATILAAGGGAGIFQNRLVSETQVGTGCVLAMEAGAAVRNLEFIQFMLVLQDGEETEFLPLPQLSRAGCMKTGNGLDVLEAHIPNPSTRSSAVACRQRHYPFSTRDASVLVDLAVARENAKESAVFWHGLPKGLNRRTVCHAAHAFNGGIQIDERAASTLPGLFAAGETAAGPHGADRIGGCMMTATQVFGRRAGQFASQQVRATRSVPDRLPDLTLLKRRGTRKMPLGRLREMESLARSCFQESLGVIRDGPGLHRCLARIHELKTEAARMAWHDPGSLRRLHCLESCLATGEAVAEAALARTHSLGAHLRIDQPMDNPT